MFREDNAVEAFRTAGTNRVAHLGAGLFAEILVHLLPVPVVVTDFLARCANGQQIAKALHFVEGGPKLNDEPLPLFFPFPLLNKKLVASDGALDGIRQQG